MAANPVEPNLALHQILPYSTFSGTFSGTTLNLHQNLPEPSPQPSSQPWPGSARTPPRPFSGTLSGTFSGTFSGTLLNVTWLCTKASLRTPRPSPEPSEPSPEPGWTWAGVCTDAHRNYSWLKTPLAYCKLLWNKNKTQYSTVQVAASAAFCINSKSYTFLFCSCVSTEKAWLSFESLNGLPAKCSNVFL